MAWVWINGLRYHVPYGLIRTRQQIPYDSWCQALSNHSEYVCTLAPHSPDTLHVSSDSLGTVSAIWGEPVSRNADGTSDMPRDVRLGEIDLFWINGAEYWLPYETVWGPLGYQAAPTCPAIHQGMECCLPPGHCARSLHVATDERGEVMGLWGIPERTVT
jgi:hypothetical protein